MLFQFLILQTTLTLLGVVLADAAVYLTIIIIPVTALYSYYVGTWRGNFALPQQCKQSPSSDCTSLLPSRASAGLSFGQVFRELDYLGIFLFIAGSLPFLMGTVWASIYSTTDAHVIEPLVVGCMILVFFALWKHTGRRNTPSPPTNICASSWGRDFTTPWSHWPSSTCSTIRPQSSGQI